MRKIFLMTGALLLLCYTMLFSQQVIKTKGGTGEGTGGSESYTVPQTANPGSMEAAAIYESIQKTYDISDVTMITDDADLFMSVYTSPENDFLSLRIEADNFNGLKYNLFDLNGKLIKSGNIQGHKTRIYMGNLASSVYLLKVSASNNPNKVYRIIRN